MLFCDMQRANAVIDSAILDLQREKANFVEVKPEVAFQELLGKAATGRPPLFDAMMTTVGTIDYTQMATDTVAMLQMLTQAGKIAPVTPSYLDGITRAFADCEEVKIRFAMLGQLARDIMAIPGLLAAMNEMGNGA